MSRRAGEAGRTLRTHVTRPLVGTASWHAQQQQQQQRPADKSAQTTMARWHAGRRALDASRHSRSPPPLRALPALLPLETTPPPAGIAARASANLPPPLRPLPALPTPSMASTSALRLPALAAW